MSLVTLQVAGHEVVQEPGLRVVEGCGGNPLPPEPGTEAFARACRGLDRCGAGYRLAKRAFDVVFSLCVLAVGLVPGLILSVFVAIDTKGTPSTRRSAWAGAAGPSASLLSR